MSAVDLTLPPVTRPAPPLADWAPLAEQTPRALGGAPADAAFRRLLERLETLARAPAEPVADAPGLQRALRRADDDYVVATDLRRRLEEAVAGGAVRAGR